MSPTGPFWVPLSAGHHADFANPLFGRCVGGRCNLGSPDWRLQLFPPPAVRTCGTDSSGLLFGAGLARNLCIEHVGESTEAEQYHWGRRWRRDVLKATRRRRCVYFALNGARRSGLGHLRSLMLWALRALTARLNFPAAETSAELLLVSGIELIL